MAKKGFSLIECLLSLSLFLIIVLSSLEFFGYARTLFLKTKNQEEAHTTALAALDKMKFDLLNAGCGLVPALHLGLLEAIHIADESLAILSKDRELLPAVDLVSGQTRIPLSSTKQITKGRELCIFDLNKGEVRSISSVYPDSIVLTSPLNFSYQEKETQMILLKKISFFLDKDRQILRRKVNSSSAQPLLEEMSTFGFDYERSSNLVKLNLSLKSDKEKKYEISVYPKNTALVASH